MNVYILTGPTGSGKTELGVELAERLGAEIVSMDSMTLYRGMDIGTAKPGPSERRRVPHHLIDVLNPWASASVAWWLEQAEACRREIESRGRKVLFVGGTPLYLKALLYGLFDGPPADLELRQRLTQESETLGRQALHDRLARVDPVTAARVHPNDVRRVIRALEVWELTGRPMSSWQQQWAVGSGQWAVGSDVYVSRNDQRETINSTQHSALSTQHSPLPTAHCPLPTTLCLDLPRDELYARIDARVQRMVEEGLVEEVRALRRLPQPISREAAQALGYKEMFDYLDGRAGLEETVVRIQTRSRNFAKRQLTWFRHLPECHPIKRELTFPAWGLKMEESGSRD